MPAVDTDTQVIASSLTRMLEIQAKRAPEAVAIVAPGRIPLSYNLLQTQISKTVAKLNTMGIGRNDRVAIVLPNGPEMAVAALAVSAGASSAPLNPALRTNEFDFYLSDMPARALLTQSGTDSPARAVAQALNIPVIELAPVLGEPAGTFDLSGEEDSRAILEGQAQPDDVALVLYTSGTTSRPKSVPLTHTNLCSSAQEFTNALELVEADRCLNVMPLFHVHGLLTALLTSLTAGSSVVCAPRFDAAMFFECLEAFRPTWYTAVPSIHEAILAQAPANRERIARCPLRFIRSGAAPLPPRVMEDLEDAFHAPVVEGYGMTESSTFITNNPLPPRKRKAGSVGLALGPELAIMSEAGRLLPVGEKGEIVIRGPGVTLGYGNNPAANQSAFTRGWFRTGDEGYLDSEGYVFITGRSKEIINRGGEKVFPRELDDALMEITDIRQAVSFAVPHPSLGEDVAAAVVLRDQASLTEPMIREYLFGRLADFKIPSQVLIVEEIPKSATGKVQRLDLAKQFARQLERKFVPPASGLETTVAGIYAEVLGVERVGATDNFFALGGDSLRATQAISRILAACRVNLPVAKLFRKPTVIELASEITSSMEANERVSITEILAELETLSEEDAQKLLDAEKRRDPPLE